ncbi:hypothetical protein MKW98_005956 [Papaver atlanticum]|uniref:Uncharacterized protein n=1 Tax=Papaver atlanticum TaxID=357466 RepID=A0AAD4TE83_9MAGN|nr:hypothetical protein MKW98_005956 [Papaver atlanticum]
MKCYEELKKRFDEGFKETKDDPDVIVYKRKRYTLTFWKMMLLKLHEDLKVRCMEMEIQETISLNHEIELGKKLEAYKIKCQGLSAELERKEMELENQLVGFDQEHESYRTRCIGMEEKIKGLIEEGIVVFDRETSAQERICYLEEAIKKMETNERERLTELEARLSKVEEENATLRALQNQVSSEKTCRDMDARVYAANEVHLTRTETSPNSTFTSSCKPSSVQVKFDGVHVSGIIHIVFIYSSCQQSGAKDYFASAAGQQVGWLRKCSRTPSSENLALVRQEDGARPSTTGIVEIDSIVKIDSEEEIVDISDRCI